MNKVIIELLNDSIEEYLSSPESKQSVINKLAEFIKGDDTYGILNLKDCPYSLSDGDLQEIANKSGKSFKVFEGLLFQDWAIDAAFSSYEAK